MKTVNVTSRREPSHIEVEKLTDGFFNVQVAENLTTETAEVKKHGSDKTETVTQYRYDVCATAVKASSYGELIAGIMHVKYNSDDEIALTNKGIADAANAEYAAYREFAQVAKEQAAKYFENE